MYLACEEIWIDRGDHSERFVRGQSLEGIPQDQLASLIETKRVSDSPIEEVTAAASGEEPAPSPEDPPAGTPLSELKLSKTVRAKLGEFSTIESLLDFGAAAGTLTAVDGVTPADEAAIQKAIEHWMRK
jgi:hypothetical protein